MNDVPTDSRTFFSLRAPKCVATSTFTPLPRPIRKPVKRKTSVVVEPTEPMAAELEKRPVCQMESLPTSRFLLEPKAMVQVAAKQLSVYGGSLETAVTDLTHYLTSGYRVLVLCGGRVRAENLHRLLRERKIPAALDFSGHAMPKKGQALIALGTLSAGSEYPARSPGARPHPRMTPQDKGSSPTPT